MHTFLAYLRLTRPANILTAMADIMLGFSIALADARRGWSGLTLADLPWPEIGWLMLATTGLYGGGVVLNDYFDADLDRVERPERPIPSGAATEKGALILGALLLLLGIVAAFEAHLVSGLIAIAIALLVLLYDAWGKHQSIFGPLNMGLCRGGNLLLGISGAAGAITNFWWMAGIPILYIAAITMVSRGEVHGSNKDTFYFAYVFYGLVIGTVVSLSWLPQFNWLTCLPFLLLFIGMIFPPLIKAAKLGEPALIGRAVKAGVLALIPLDAAIAAGFGGWQYGLAVLLLLPFSLLLAKAFAVT
ncbi:MAG: UbiA-like protein EboC [Cyclobacteriaceae bacterium]